MRRVAIAVLREWGLALIVSTCLTAVTVTMVRDWVAISLCVLNVSALLLGIANTLLRTYERGE